MWALFAQEQTSQGWSDVIDRLARTPLSKVILAVAICTLVRVAIAPVLARVPVHKRNAAFTLGRLVNEALDAIIYAGVFVFLLIRPFCIQAFKIPSGSMKNTLMIDDFIVANKAVYRYSDPKVGDIVVFRPPTWACFPNQIDADGDVNVDFIKRCVGVPGDTVEIRNGTLYRNGVSQPETFIRQKPQNDFKLVKYKQAPGIPDMRGQYWPLNISGDQVNSDRSQTAQPFLVTDTQTMDTLRSLRPEPVPKGYYLMMGDNRNESFDGRSWGLVPREEVIGRSEIIWMPISRWRVTK